MASYNISNPPSIDELTLNKIRSTMASDEGPSKSSRFIARITPNSTLLWQIALADADMDRGITTDLAFLCESTELPGRAFTAVDVRYYGPSMKLPFQTQYEEISLNFLCRAEAKERQFFDNWMSIIHPLSTFNFEYRDNYRANIELFQFDEKNRAQYSFTLVDAYPLIVNAQPVTWADSEFLRLGVSFTYHYWKRVGNNLDAIGPSSDGSRGSNFVLGSKSVF
jgi:hypothetical protein